MTAEPYYAYIFAKAVEQDWEIERSLLDELHDRQQHLNASFAWTKENVAALQSLNEMLSQKEMAAHSFYNNWKLTTELMQRDGAFEDFNLNFKIHLFNNWQKGNSFFTHHHLIGPGAEKGADSRLLTTNWSDLALSHPLSCFRHCLLFHELYDHSPLAWQDLLTTTTAWLEMKVDYQWFIEN